MAERRMFSREVIGSDAFLDMPVSAQALYFHLGMNADDDGFINSPKRIQRMVGAQEDDLKLLIAKRFIITFESGVVVIKHWKMHNYIRADRHKPTSYQDEMKMLFVKENGSYTLNKAHACQPPVNHLSTKCQPSVNQVTDSDEKLSTGSDDDETVPEEDENPPRSVNSNGSSLCQPNDNQVSTKCQPSDGIGKDRLGKDSIDKINIVKDRLDKEAPVDNLTREELVEKFTPQMKPKYRARLEEMRKERDRAQAEWDREERKR